MKLRVQDLESSENVGIQGLVAKVPGSGRLHVAKVPGLGRLHIRLCSGLILLMEEILRHLKSRES